MAPLLRPGGDVIEGQYIVMLHDGSALSGASSALSLLKEDPIHIYEHVIQGFAAKFDMETLETLRLHPDVDYVENDGYGYAPVEPFDSDAAVQSQNSTGASYGSDINSQEIVTQQGATWGISRVSSKSPEAKDYKYDSSAGAGTCSYILDTGIYLGHDEFTGRVKLGKKIAPGAAGDAHGHGTHCAGTVGGTLYGIAKKTQLIDVKVLDDKSVGQWSDIIAGIDFVGGDKTDCPKGKFVNMSIGGGPNKGLNDASTKLSKSGVFVGTAAGNSNKDGKTSSPGSASDVCNVGATDKSDTKAGFSNFGSTLAVWAPGVEILSARPQGGSVRISVNRTLSKKHMITDKAIASNAGHFDGLPSRCRFGGILGCKRRRKGTRALQEDCFHGS